ncbi:MAG: hypothetical protein EB116_19090 [Betaproteobacteria bacterium]|nr:hypothetical protein [Betaproteobacteria bacterium]
MRLMPGLQLLVAAALVSGAGPFMANFLPAPASIALREGTAMLLALTQSLQQQGPAPRPQQADSLAVARGLSDAADLRAWLTTAELAGLLRVAPSTVLSWADGQQPRPGFRLDRRRVGVGVWWRVSTCTD